MKNIIVFFYKTYYLYLLVAFLITVVLSVTNLEAKSFWFDEVFSIRIATDLSVLKHASIYSEANMLFYHFLLHFWLKLGNSEFIIRSLSSIFAILTIPSIYILGRKLFSEKVGIIAALLLSVNGFIIEYAQEARGYSLLIFLITIATFYLVSLANNFNKKNYIGYLLFSILALYTHFFAIFIISVHAVFLLVKSKRNLLYKQLFMVFIPILLTILPILFFPSFKDQGGINWIQRINFIDIIILFSQLSGGPYTAIISFLVLFIPFLVFYKKRPILNKSIVLVLASLCLPIILTILVSVFIKPIFLVKYLIICLPFFILLQGYLLSRISNRKLLMVVLFVFFVLSLLNIQRLYHSTIMDKENWRAAAQYVSSNYMPNDVIFFYSYFVRDPFEYYYKNKLSENNTDLNMPELSLAKYRDGGGVDLPEPNLVIIDTFKSKRIWLILSHDSVTASREKQKKEILDKIKEHYQLIKTINYTGIRILLFER